MSVKITGVKEILENIEAKLGTAKVNKIVNKTLRDSADIVVDTVKEGVSYYKRTGATVEEVVKSGIKGAAQGVRTIDVGWRGDKNRWRLVHLNEFGFTRKGKRITPRGFGAVQKAYDKSQEKYWQKVNDGLEELTK